MLFGVVLGGVGVVVGELFPAAGDELGEVFGEVLEAGLVEVDPPDELAPSEPTSAFLASQVVLGLWVGLKIGSIIWPARRQAKPPSAAETAAIA